MTREAMNFDVIIVGAGPAGLSAAIRLAQLSQQQQKPLNICVLEKSAEVGAQLLSGAVLEPRALNELIPDWQEKKAPLHTVATEDQFFLLTKHKAWQLPTPLPMRNKGNTIISLAEFCRWLATIAESLGVNIFPGFAGTTVLYDGDRVCGIATDDKGLDKQGHPKANYQPGIHLYAKQILFAEGCRGSLTETVCARYHLRKNKDPQTYALGIKELWEMPAGLLQPGRVMHSIGWPLDQKTYGGSFIYHLTDKLLAIGFVTGLDYANPYLNPYEEFQRFKMHPFIYPTLSQGRRIAYGARCLNEGGLQSIPKLTFPGGMLIGCAAGFLNVPKIKGIHTAMKSGMVAAESLFPDLHKDSIPECTAYPENLKSSWLWQELYRARNIRPAMRLGLWPGLAYAAFDTYILRGRAPWTFHYRKPDHASLKEARFYQPLTYPKHDQKVSFNISASLFLARIQAEENQPLHLHLKDKNIPTDINLKVYAGPEQRYCPAGVYEFVHDPKNAPRLQINAANCIHCKACDIKDPNQNIVWTTPEGGSGPQYGMM